MSVDDGESSLASGFRSSLVSIQESLKWLIAAAGATAAFVVGGLQLRGIPSGGQDISLTRATFLVGAPVVGLVAIFGLLFWTAYILTLRRLTASELIRRERDAGVQPTAAVTHPEIKDKWVKWVLDQRTYLLGEPLTIQALYIDHFVRSSNALSAMRRAKLTDWNGEAVDASKPESLLRIRHDIQDSLDAARAQLILVEDAVHFERTRSAYRKLTWFFPVGAGVLIVAIAVFAMASRLPEPPVRVTQPIPVAILVKDRGAAGLPPGCTSNDLTGVAVDGRLRSPTVIVDGPGDCRGSRIDDGHGVVVIPKPATGSGRESAPDLEFTSLQQLRELASSDRPSVSAQLADRWVPQLSSKRPGVIDEGVVWDNAATLQEHLALRQRYGAKLLWSGDWSTFDAPDFWITIVPITFNDSDGALKWCSSQGLDRDHCYAKIVSTTHPIPASTAYN